MAPYSVAEEKDYVLIPDSMSYSGGAQDAVCFDEELEPFALLN